MKKIAIIDGDEVAFRIASIYEDRGVRATNTLDTNEVYSAKHRTELKKLLGSLNKEIKDFNIEDVQIPSPTEFAISSVEKTIENILLNCNTGFYEVYLSGEDNFRDRLPLPTKYKSSRIGLIRPVLLNKLRDYLIQSHKAINVYGYEVDDKLTIRCAELASRGVVGVAVTQDKDALGCNNLTIYNHVKKTHHKVSGLGKLSVLEDGSVKGFGFKWKCFQWVYGDPTDNYKPCELAAHKGKKVRFGEKSAFLLLNDCQSYRDCIQQVYNTYKLWYPTQFEYMSWDGNIIQADKVYMMDLYLKCCHMLRHKDDFIDINKLLEKYEIER